MVKVIPFPSYTKNIDELERIYKQALKEIVARLQAVDPKDYVSQELYQSQIQQLSYLLNELNNKSRSWVEGTIKDAFESSLAVQMVSLGQASTLLEAKGKLQFSLMSRQRMEAIISDTFGDVLQATTYMDNKLKQHVRDIQANAIRLSIAQQQGSVDIAQRLKKDLIEAGLSKSLQDTSWVGITDAGGNRWDLTTYVKMVAKTKIQQTQIEGARIMALENNTDLAIISSHGAKDSCSHFENMLISLEGRTKGYPTLAEVKGSGLIFHPNCQHSVHVIGDVQALPQSLKDQADKAQKSAEYAMANAKEIKAQDNQRRYQDKKEKLQRIKQQRVAQLKKAREKRAQQR